MESKKGDAPDSAGVAVALSTLLEGFGQAYNRQPVKAVVFLVTGLTLSTASGLNTWVVRTLLGLTETRIGPDRFGRLCSLCGRECMG